MLAGGFIHRWRRAVTASYFPELRQRCVFRFPAAPGKARARCPRRIGLGGDLAGGMGPPRSFGMVAITSAVVIMKIVPGGPWRHAVPMLGRKSVAQWISIDIGSDTLYISSVQIDTPAAAGPDGGALRRAELGGMDVLAIEFHGCKMIKVADDRPNIRRRAPDKKMDMLGHNRAGVNTVMFDSAIRA